MTTDSLQDSRLHKSDFWSHAKPDWVYWSHLNRCKLWEASALTCNIDPTIFRASSFTSKTSDRRDRSPTPDNVSSLLESAKFAAGSGNLKVIRSESGNLIESEVLFSDFSNWLQVIGIKAPLEFPHTPLELRNGHFSWPWGTYQTPALILLALAADKFWRLYDPSDYTTAPKNSDVVKWLMSKKLSKHKADMIATLLRDENVRSGPR